MSVLFEHVTAVTMDEERRILKDAYVAVEGSKIASVGTQRPQGAFDRVIDGAGKVLMPGFVNAHTHLPMTLMRGYGGGQDLQHWLNDFIFPAEAKLDQRAVAAGTGLGLAEMIASGVTCVADMYMKTGTIARQIVEAGISANLSCGGVYFGAPEDFSPETCGDCRNQIALTEEWHGANDGQILVDASVHAEYTSNPPLWRWMADYAMEHRLNMHVHVSETVSEHQACLERWGRTPTQILDQYGVWDSGNWAIMSKKHVSCVHNPWSNLKLGSGVAPVPDMLQAGVNVALGTDGMSSHNSADLFSDVKLAACHSADLFSDVKLAACLQAGVRRDPMALSACQALEMATVNGAEALGRDTGVIAPGKTADLILVDFSAPNLTPCHDVAENLVYAAHGSNVDMNMARGKVIYEKGEFFTLDLERIRYEVERYALPLLFGSNA